MISDLISNFIELNGLGDDANNEKSQENGEQELNKMNNVMVIDEKCDEENKDHNKEADDKNKEDINGNDNLKESDTEKQKNEVVLKDNQQEVMQELSVISILSNLNKTLIGMQNTSVEILKHVTNKEDKIVTTSNNQTLNQIDKQINIQNLNQQTTIINNEKKDSFYNLYVQANNAEESVRIRQEIRDSKLLDGENPVVIVGFKYDSNNKEVAISFADNEDYNKIADCLNGKFRCSSTSDQNLTKSGRYVIYGFKNKNAESLIYDIVRFNKDKNNEGVKIFNKSSVRIDPEKFVFENGAAAIVEFIGDEILNRIKSKPKILIEFGERDLVKYYAIKICKRCCLPGHEENVCTNDVTCFKCGKNHSGSNCEVRGAKMIRCFRCSKKFTKNYEYWKANHIANSLACFARKEDMKELDKD